jgi:SAM-dependent methyltransferase
MEIVQNGRFASPGCPLCAESHTRHRVTKGGYAVYRCPNCKLEFLHPQPDDGVLASIYGADYFLGHGSKKSEERTAELKRATACLYLRRLQRTFSHGGGRILEVGCGNGDFLLQARQGGCQVHGIEYSASAAEIANQRLGPGTVQNGTLGSVAVPDGSFDAVVACDVIEHVRDPRLFLNRAHACLRPGGALFLVTPSVDSWSCRCMRSHWMEYKVEHLFYFGTDSLRLLLESTGFENPVFRPNQKVISVDYIYQHFRRYSVPVLTLLISVLRHSLPGALPYRQWKIAGSGVIVIAHKPLTATYSNGT